MPSRTKGSYKAVVAVMDLLTRNFPETKPIRLSPFRVCAPGINGPVYRTRWEKAQHKGDFAPVKEFLHKVSTGHKGLIKDCLTISKLQGSDLIVDKVNEPNNFPEKLQEALRIAQGNGEELFAFIYRMLYYAFGL